MLDQYGLSKVTSHFNRFWTDIFQNWGKLRERSSESDDIPTNILTQSIWFNNQRLSRACIVHLVIKHLGIMINIKNTKFVKDLPMIDAQFRFNQCNSFREEYISVFSPYGSVLIL